MISSEVILHMICQSCEMNRAGRVTVSDVARWTEKSKPTIQKWLDKLVIDGWLHSEKKQWRPNAVIYLYYPTQDTIIRYSRRDFKAYYDMFLRELETRMVKVRQEILL